jgi:hypothetical protein
MAVMDVKEYRRRDRRRRAAALVAVFAAAVAVTVGIAIRRPVPRQDLWELVAGLATLSLIVASIAGMILSGAFQPPAEYEKRRAEFAQWKRWQSCLYTYPPILMFWAVWIGFGVHNWAVGKRDFYVPVWVGFMTIIAAMYLGQMRGGRRGEPGTPMRRQHEYLNDELSRAHEGEAFRWGFYALGAGTMAAVATALFAPPYAASAGVAAFGLGCATASFRFGLLQRAAEGEVSSEELE